MKTEPCADSEALTPEQIRHVEQVCDRFEAAWQAAGSTGGPSIEEHLGDTAESERRVLLRELLVLELGYRRRRGEAPKLEDYQSRFAEYAAQLSLCQPELVVIGQTLSHYRILERMGSG